MEPGAARSMALAQSAPENDEQPGSVLLLGQHSNRLEALSRKPPRFSMSVAGALTDR